MRTTDRGVWVIGRGVGSAFPAVSHREEGLLHHAGRTAKRFRCILAFFSFILAPRRDGALHRDSHAPHSIPVAIENGMVLASVTYKGASLAACGGGGALCTPGLVYYPSGRGVQRASTARNCLRIDQVQTAEIGSAPSVAGSSTSGLLIRRSLNRIARCIEAPHQSMF
jgi:hypothetical protein